MASEAAQAAVFKPPAGAPPGQRLGLALLVVAVLCLICAPFFTDPIAHDAPQVHAGVVDYTRWGPLQAPVELGGQWRAVWRTPPAPDANFWVKVPGSWSGLQVRGHALPESGAATYSVLIRGLQPGRHVLYVPRIYAASRVLVNGRTIATMGQYGLTPQTSHYTGRSQDLVIEADGRDLRLQIDLSTFHHRENGMPEPPVLGLQAPMDDWILLDWVRSLLLATSLMLLTCLAAVIFVFRREDRASMYLAMGAATLLPLAATLSHDNLIAVATPWASFDLQISFQLLSTTAALSAALAYVHGLFPRESARLPYLVIQAMNAARFAFYAYLAGTGQMIALSHYSAAMIPFRVLVLLYMLGVVAAACVRRRDGAVLFMLGLGAMTGGVVYTDLVTNGGWPRLSINLLAMGMLVLLFSQLVLLAQRWSLAIATEAQANSDLRRLLDVNISITSEMQLETLLKKVVEVTSKVIRADRGSLFLHDPRKDELWSVVAEGLDEKQIRFPAGDGLAGWAFTHGEAVNLPDAYADARFNRDVDAATGYRTQSVLAAPVITRDGRRLGVMQALNRLDGGRFDTADFERLSAFAAQAAVAIDNATLFSDVAAERNYNESILASMSSGVLTLDRDARLTKINPAAVRILEVQPDQLAGVDARAWLKVTNPAMLSEVDEVIATGRPKTLLDVDIRTARDNVVSANVSIVPLVVAGAPVGLLVLIEDITEGKRVQGAMRRFMTPAVVDQVMSRGDDLMFGAACRASVLFADIRNFTAMAEALQPRETVDMLNEVFTELVEAVAANDGVLDKFMGDAIMAVYGAPISSGQDPHNAVESAVTMMRMVQDLKDRSGHPIGLGVSIATGEVIAGTIGSPRRMDYTVIGDCVNLAARMQQVSKLYRVGVVICEATAAAVADTVALRELDLIRVRGRQQPTRIFQVLTGPASAACAAYQKGREALAARHWRAAVSAFEAAVEIDPDDPPSVLMLDRARALARKPPAADWDGVWDPGEPG
jgi:adenylate cyclase